MKVTARDQVHVHAAAHFDDSGILETWKRPGRENNHEHVTSPTACKKASDSLRMPPTLEMKFLSEASTNYDHEICTPR